MRESNAATIFCLCCSYFNKLKLESLSKIFSQKVIFDRLQRFVKRMSLLIRVADLVYHYIKVSFPFSTVYAIP